METQKHFAKIPRLFEAPDNVSQVIYPLETGHPACFRMGCGLRKQALYFDFLNIFMTYIDKSYTCTNKTLASDESFGTEYEENCRKF